MKAIVCGYGRMGQIVERLLLEDGNEIVGIVDVNNASEFQDMPEADVIIDFSNPAMLEHIISYMQGKKTALVCGTTGFGEGEYARLKELSTTSKVLYSANYSLGICAFVKALEIVSPILKEISDVEIIEKHHNKKVDAPSGTAKLLASAVNSDGVLNEIHSRSGNCGVRPKNEMGVFALRGGTVAGEHSVFFFGEDETFELKHTAFSRTVFVAGAIKASKMLLQREIGYYSLNELMFN